MALLEPFGNDLTKYIIQRLNRHKISKVSEFLFANDKDLTKITNLSETTITELKRDLRKLHGVHRAQLSHIRRKIVKETKYNTGIESLDCLLGESSLFPGAVWEICGFSGTGKTQLCHTISLNLIKNYNCDTLYIDTKYDFSGIRIRQMLKSRNISKTDAGRIMQQIKVERVDTLEGVIKVLKELCVQLEIENADCKAIKFIVIDALPAIWFQHRERERMFLLSTLVNTIWKLALQYMKTFLLVNLTVYKETNLFENGLQYSQLGDTDGEVNEEALMQASVESSIVPALGRYWSSVPHLRLCIKSNEKKIEPVCKRTIAVLKNCYGPTGGNCNVSITDAGVI
ncbi:DNA repair protein RAD51 homolog 4 [Teleopsis dalmanni]|uniref:DNA repair protein RAD51 homolog 4 n=1 Tax=Teleopsis dalmanni TaxID=139649 RepID=UPI0018CD3089|nr:DNA repair protein RAD51 homolog 4 [Teleopsis dalmanni]